MTLKLVQVETAWSITPVPTHLTLEQFEEFVLTPPAHWQSGYTTETRAACDFQLYFEAAVSGLTMERAAHRKGRSLSV